MPEQVLARLGGRGGRWAARGAERGRGARKEPAQTGRAPRLPASAALLPPPAEDPPSQRWRGTTYKDTRLGD